MYLEELVALYLKACAVEGKTECTVKSHAETLRQFRRGVKDSGASALAPSTGASAKPRPSSPFRRRYAS